MNIPGTLMAPAQGMANLSNSLMNLSTSMIEIDERRKQQESAAMRLAELSKYNLTVSRDIDNIFTQAERSEPGKIDEFRPLIEGKFNEFWDSVNQIDDPILKGMVTKQHAALQISYGQKFNDLATKKNREFAVTSFLDSFDYGMKTYLNTADPDAEGKAMSDMANALQRAEVSGVITPELANRAKNDMERAVNKKAVANYEGGILNAENMTAPEMTKYMQSLMGDSRLTMTDKRTLAFKADATFKGVIKERNIQGAFGEAAKLWTDPRQAMVEVLKPEFGKSYGLTIDQQQNISQSFSVMATQKAFVDKDRQEQNLDQIRATAIKDPPKALRLIQAAGDVDPKEALSLKNSIESHIRQQSLMSAQEKALQMDMVDKIKANIKTNIISGKYKTEQEVVNAVIASGIPKTSEFLDDALGNFKEFRKEAGAVNYFKQAEDDWDRLISTTKDKGRKKELQTMKTGMLTALQTQMQTEGIRVSDPQVFELYKAHKKSLTDTWFTRTLDRIWGGDDTMVKPETAPQAPRPSMSAPALDEKTARERLRGMKVTKEVEERQIQIYRDKGWIR